MPELPEVETTRRGIAPHIEGRRVQRVTVRQPRLRWPVSPELGQCLTGRIIRRVGRRGKYLLLETGRGKVMMHLGMSGSLRIVPADKPPGKHDHVDLDFENRLTLRFHDPRRFGSVFWLQDNEHPLLAELGPEPLGPVFDGDYLYGQARGRRLPVKSLIMNSRVVTGVGNIYACESLFLAGIHPCRQSGRISRIRYGILAECIREVLQKAIDAGGTTLMDFVREDGTPGYFGQSLTVYGRSGQPCMQCGALLREVRLSGRSTVFCRHCQT